MVQIIVEAHHVKARKEHECFHCGGKISKGEKHFTGTYKDDDIYNVREHIRCKEFAFNYGDLFYDEGGFMTPMWNWEHGLLPNNIEAERLSILKEARSSQS